MSPALPSTAAERLATPIQFVKGVGPERAKLLERLELRTASDLLFFFPRDYRDASQLRRVRELVENEPASYTGRVEEVELRNTGPGRCLLGALIRQDQEHVRGLWFNQPWMREKLPVGTRVLLIGEPRFNGGRWEFVHPRVELLADDEDPPAGRILPVYPLTEGLNQAQMRRLVHGTVEAFAECLEDVFPEPYLLAHRLLPIRQALTQIHAPASMADLQQARYRLIYQELLVLQLALALRRQQHDQRCHAPPLPATARIDARIRRLFPFELTAAQNQALAEITADMAQTRPMNRLLQGDVGSGKTVVAEYAMLLTVAHGYQAAMMAPTEMLARQHAGTLARDLQHSKVRIALLTGGLSAAERRAALERITADEVDLIVGTHALLQEDLALPKLGLVVIDEQHKFGVRQRAALRGAGTDPHYLVMTATPIPRTVSMTLFGDLDISTLREAPPGRPQVHTYLAEPGQRAKWWEFVRKKLAEGRQAYVIAPLVSGSDEEDVAGAEQIFQALQAGELAGHRLDLVHGRVSPGQREQIMQAFRDGRTQVLVATSVLEVGIDVPNATLLTIEGGERFGLAQLHQMRGRVSRGLYPGYVCVFADATRDESRRRLEAFRQSRDGFQLAETDFQLRGPGDLFGTRQHGLPPFHIADPLRDQEILEVARREARELAGPQGRLDQPEFARLRRMVVRRYGQALDLADAG